MPDFKPVEIDWIDPRTPEAGRVKHYWNEWDPYAAAWIRNLIDACDWLDFRDGKTRPIEPGLECLVDGLPFVLADGRAGRAAQSRAKILKVIGNAIVPEVGAAFIRAYCESMNAA